MPRMNIMLISEDGACTVFDRIGWFLTESDVIYFGLLNGSEEWPNVKHTVRLHCSASREI